MQKRDKDVKPSRYSHSDAARKKNSFCFVFEIIINFFVSIFKQLIQNHLIMKIDMQVKIQIQRIYLLVQYLVRLVEKIFC